MTTLDHRRGPDPADFYMGRGANAEYLGSVPDLGAPEDFDIWGRFQNLGDDNYTADDFRDEVAELRNESARGGAELFAPATWPHPHATSAETPWAYVFDAGTVYVYRYGVEMAAVRCNYTRPGPHGTREPRRPQSVAPLFPIMRDPASV